MSCQRNHPLLLVFGAVSLVVLKSAAAPSKDFYNQRVIHAQDVNSTDIVPYIDNGYKNDIPAGNDISSTGNYIALNNQGVYAELINPTRVLTLSIKGTQVFLNSRVVCNDIKTLSREKTYQNTRGSMWYTNLKVGKPMSEEEIADFKNKLKEAREKRAKTSDDVKKKVEQGQDKDMESKEEKKKQIQAVIEAGMKSMDELSKQVEAELEANRKTMEKLNKRMQEGSEAGMQSREDAYNQKVEALVAAVTKSHEKTLKAKEAAIIRAAAIARAEVREAALRDRRAPEKAITYANKETTMDGRTRDEKYHMRRQRDDELMRKREAPRKWASCNARS